MKTEAYNLKNVMNETMKEMKINYTDLYVKKDPRCCEATL